jgi:hypothetical protein
MPMADRVHSTPPTNTPLSQVDATSRRRFLSNAAGIAAGGAVLAMATIPPAPAMAVPAGSLDPVFALIANHKETVGTVDGIVAEINRADEIDAKIALEDGPLAEQGGVEMDLFLALTVAVPTTLAGIVALVTYLDEVNKRDPWKFEDNYATPVIGALATAFSRMAVTS